MADMQIDNGPVLCVNRVEERRFKDFEKLAQFMGWKFYSEHPLPEEIKDNVPCAVLDKAEGELVLLVYRVYKTDDVVHADGVEEKWIVASTYWNPFNEVHDAFELLTNEPVFWLRRYGPEDWTAWFREDFVGRAKHAAEAICESVLCFIERA